MTTVKDNQSRLQVTGERLTSKLNTSEKKAKALEKSQTRLQSEKRDLVKRVSDDKAEKEQLHVLPAFLRRKCDE